LLVHGEESGVLRIGKTYHQAVARRIILGRPPAFSPFTGFFDCISPERDT
jgi:hypothetical protein